MVSLLTKYGFIQEEEFVSGGTLVLKNMHAMPCTRDSHVWEA